MPSKIKSHIFTVISFKYLPFLGTASSSNTMVPGPDGHHDSKLKDSNIEDRLELILINKLEHFFFYRVFLRK